jgi:hypothetical protein
MSPPVNMPELVRSLPARSRGKACIVLTHAYQEQKAWAAELARQTGAMHLDLLDAFAHDQEMAARLRYFSVSAFFEYLKQHNTSMLIVSRMEFLMATWSGQSDITATFAHRVESWNTNPALLFALQYDKPLAAYPFTKRYGSIPFVVDQKETLAL